MKEDLQRLEKNLELKGYDCSPDTKKTGILSLHCTTGRVMKPGQSISIEIDKNYSKYEMEGRAWNEESFRDLLQELRVI